MEVTILYCGLSSFYSAAADVVAMVISFLQAMTAAA